MSENAAAKSWTAAKWLPVVQSAGVLTEMLGQAKNDQARAIAVGKFLSAKVGQEVPVTQGGRTGKAVLRSAGGPMNGPDRLLSNHFIQAYAEA